jgi:hypothetical protein
MLTTDRDEAVRATARTYDAALAAAVDPRAPSHDFGDVVDAILDLSTVVPDGVQDTDLKHLLRLTLETRQAMAAGDQDRALEATAYGRLVLRRIVERSAAGSLEDPATAFATVDALLPTATIKELARLLGVSEKTVSTWRAGGTIERGAARVIRVAQICHDLRTTFTGSGILAWFDTATHQLDGRTPLEALGGSPSAVADVVDFARRIGG